MTMVFTYLIVQLRLLEKYVGDVTLRKMIWLLVGAFGLVLAITTVILLSKRKAAPSDPLSNQYLRFCRILASQGIERRVGEGPLHFLRRVCDERPELSGEAG